MYRLLVLRNVTVVPANSFFRLRQPRISAVFVHALPYGLENTSSPIFTRHPKGMLNPPIFRAMYRTQVCPKTIGSTNHLFSSQFWLEKKTLDFSYRIFDGEGFSNYAHQVVMTLLSMYLSLCTSLESPRVGVLPMNFIHRLDRTCRQYRWGVTTPISRTLFKGHVEYPSQTLKAEECCKPSAFEAFIVAALAIQEICG